MNNMATKSLENEWRGLQANHEEVITITKLKDSLLHIRAWKKSGTSFVPALITIYTISPKAAATRLGECIQNVMETADEKKAWLET